MDENHSIELEPSSSSAFQLRPEPETETFSILIARAAIFIFLFGVVCLLLNVDRSTLGTILLGVALVFVILYLKKIIRANWRRRRTRRGSTMRICVPTHQWTSIFRDELPTEHDLPRPNPFNSLDNLMQLSEGLFQTVPELLPPTYEQAVAEMDPPPPTEENEMNGRTPVDNDREQQIRVQGLNLDTEAKSVSNCTETSAEEAQ